MSRLRVNVFNRRPHLFALLTGFQRLCVLRVLYPISYSVGSVPHKGVMPPADFRGVR